MRDRRTLHPRCPRSWWGVLASARLALAILTATAAVVLAGAALSAPGGADEAAATMLVLREAGYVVQSAERVTARTFPGNLGESIEVPGGGRLYRIIYRLPGGRYREAYRLVAGPFRERWFFPSAR